MTWREPSENDPNAAGLFWKLIPLIISSIITNNITFESGETEGASEPAAPVSQCDFWIVLFFLSPPRKYNNSLKIKHSH